MGAPIERTILKGLMLGNALLVKKASPAGTAYRLYGSRGILLDFAITNRGRRFERRKDIRDRIIANDVRRGLAAFQKLIIEAGRQERMEELGLIQQKRLNFIGLSQPDPPFA